MRMDTRRAKHVFSLVLTPLTTLVMGLLVMLTSHDLSGRTGWATQLWSKNLEGAISLGDTEWARGTWLMYTCSGSVYQGVGCLREPLFLFSALRKG